MTKDSTIYATQNAYSRALFWSAWTNFHTGEIQKAKEEILAAQILEPDNPTILCEAAIIQLNQKDSIYPWNNWDWDHRSKHRFGNP